MQGTGLFTAGFFGGYLLLLLLLLSVRHRAVWLRLYGPFLPFVLGAWAVIPHVLQRTGVMSTADLKQPVWNLFIFYPVLSAADTAAFWPAQVEAQIALASAAYLHLLCRYVRLVQSVSTHAE